MSRFDQEIREADDLNLPAPTWSQFRPRVVSLIDDIFALRRVA